MLTLEQRLDDARQSWLAAWLDDSAQSSSALPRISCQAAHESMAQIKDGANWRALAPSSGLSDEQQVWIDMHRAEESMAQLLLKSPSLPKGSSLVEQVAAQALADCIAGLDAALTVSPGNAGRHRVAAKPAAIPAPHYRPWSGAVHVRLPLSEALALTLHLAPARVAALLATATGASGGTPRPALVSLNEALAAHSTRLRVELAAVDISVGNLQSLTVGDVLVLPHPLTQTLQVKTTQGLSLCEGYLGQQQGQRAIELIKRTPSQSVSR